VQYENRIKQIFKNWFGSCRAEAFAQNYMTDQ